MADTKDQTDGLGKCLSRFGRPLWRDVRWFLWGWGLGRPEKNAASAIGHTISLLGVILAGNVGLGLGAYAGKPAVSNWLFLLVCLIAIGGMTSILRSSNKGACETLCGVHRAAERDLRHYYDYPTILFTRWMLVSCVIFLIVSFILANLGYFPGQPDPVRLWVNSVSDHQYTTEEYLGKPGLICHVPVNSAIYANGTPRWLCFQLTLPKDLAGHWGVTTRCDLLEWDAKIQDYKKVSHGTYLCDTKRLDNQRWELKPLDAARDYRLDVFLAMKEKVDDPKKADDLCKEAGDKIAGRLVVSVTENSLLQDQSQTNK